MVPAVLNARPKAAHRPFTVEDQAHSLAIVLRREFGVPFVFYHATTGLAVQGSLAEPSESWRAIPVDAFPTPLPPEEAKRLGVDTQADVSILSDGRYRLVLVFNDGNTPLLVAAVGMFAGLAKNKTETDREQKMAATVGAIRQRPVAPQRAVPAAAEAARPTTSTCRPRRPGRGCWRWTTSCASVHPQGADPQPPAHPGYGARPAGDTDACLGAEGSEHGCAAGRRAVPGGDRMPPSGRPAREEFRLAGCRPFVVQRYAVHCVGFRLPGVECPAGFRGERCGVERLGAGPQQKVESNRRCGTVLPPWGCRSADALRRCPAAALPPRPDVTRGWATPRSAWPAR